MAWCLCHTPSSAKCVTPPPLTHAPWITGRNKCSKLCPAIQSCHPRVTNGSRSLLDREEDFVLQRQRPFLPMQIISNQAAMQSYCKQMDTCRQILHALRVSLALSQYRGLNWIIIWLFGVFWQAALSQISLGTVTGLDMTFFSHPQNRAEFTLYCLGNFLDKSSFLSDSLYIPAVSTQADDGHACIWLQEQHTEYKIPNGIQSKGFQWPGIGIHLPQNVLL